MLTPFFKIGEVLRPQGVHGEAKVAAWAMNPEDFRRWTTLYLRRGDGYEPLEARCSRVHDGFAYVTLGTCSSPEDVEKLRGEALYIDRAHAGVLPEGMYYIADLIGCVAVDEEGQELGTLREVLQHGPTDVYVFGTADRRTWMAPALPDAFPVRDVEHNVIRVNSARLKEVAVYAD
ncbi:MAG: 16S rRNA processing protein RimM [Clostridia bacterium]|nr:16S rRNA processing protein RimM [Clostridia bacterium]